VTNMDVVVLTGLSGAGKSTAVDVLEDIGYYCVDNMPPTLLEKFMELIAASKKSEKVAVVMDVRGFETFDNASGFIGELKRAGNDVKVIYLDCDSSVILHRYKETRRRHPLIDKTRNQTTIPDLNAALAAEKEILLPIKNVADFVLDTTFLSSAQLREQIKAIFSKTPGGAMLINCVSFGFKYGIPAEADMVFDVRCLPNPFYYEELKHLTGLDQPVYDFVMKFEESRKFYDQILSFLEFSVPYYLKEGKTQLVVAIGCTGGHHRSVAFAQDLYEHFRDNGYNVMHLHRDIEK